MKKIMIFGYFIFIVLFYGCNLISFSVMKRKTLLSIVACLLTAAAVIVSCQREKGPEEPNDIYERIGQLHNEGLDYAFEYMKACQTKVNVKLDQQQILAKGLEAVDLFLTEKGILNSKTKTSSPLFIENYDGAGLTTGQKKYYEELIHVIVNKSLDYTNTQRAVEQVRMNVIANLPAQDAEILLYGIAIAKYSLEYWHENADKWRTAGNINAFAYRVMTKGENPEGEDSLDWKEVAKGDVSGAIGGAAAGILAGGVGAGPGALAGGVAGSVAAGVGELWDYIFG